MEQPERLPQDDMTLRGESAKKFFREFEKQNPALAEHAKEFNREVDEKTFWNEERLAAIFNRDGSEYRDFLRWIAAVYAATRMRGVHMDKDDTDRVDGSFSDALHPDTWGRTAEDSDELPHIQARKVILLRGEVIMMGVDPSRLSEARYERWKERRPHYAED